MWFLGACEWGQQSAEVGLACTFLLLALSVVEHMGGTAGSTAGRLVLRWPKIWQLSRQIRQEELPVQRQEGVNLGGGAIGNIQGACTKGFLSAPC